MGNIVIADAGATKITWLILAGGDASRRVRTAGVNALTASYAEATEVYREAAAAISAISEDVAAVHYYGTGCSTPQVCRETAARLQTAWPGTAVEVAGDMLLCARAMLGHSPGVACILGTGSNAAVYDGHGISRGGAGLGFVMGDNGSGCELGKRLLSDWLKGLLPADLHRDFAAYGAPARETLLERVYRGKAPARWLASFAPFLSQRRGHPYVDAMLADEFRRFVTRDILPLVSDHGTPIGCAGSIARVFENELRDAIRAAGLTGDVNVAGDPMDGIAGYYLSPQCQTTHTKTL